MELDPTLPDVRVLLGESLMNLGWMEEAVAVLGADVEPASLAPKRSFLLGQAYLKLRVRFAGSSVTLI